MLLSPPSKLSTGGSRGDEDDIDGHNVLMAARRFFDDPADPELAMAAIGSLPASIVLTMLVEPDPLAALAERATAIRRAPDRPLDEGVMAPVVELQLPDGPDLLLVIDPRSHFIRQIHLISRDQASLAITWTSGAIESEPKAIARLLEAHARSLYERRDRAGIAEPGGFRAGVRSGRVVVPTPSGRSIAAQIKALFAHNLWMIRPRLTGT